MNMNKPQEPDVDLDDEYGRIAENEMIYDSEISLWEKLRKFTFFLYFMGFVLLMMSIALSPPNTPMLELLSDHPMAAAFFLVGFALMPTMLLTRALLSRKTSRIKNELGLHRDERIYLRAYETFTTIDSYLKESQPKRKLYFKRLALQNTEELTEIVGGWKYGNVRLVANLIGDKIDLLKDNMKRLILSNVAKGDEGALKKTSEILMELCKYIHSPSLEKLDELNDMIEKIPFKEYKYLTKKERMRSYFYSRPRIFRLLFASGITIFIAVVLYCLGQNIGLIVAVCVTCFWGSFAGFDKIFKIEEKL